VGEKMRVIVTALVTATIAATLVNGAAIAGHSKLYKELIETGKSPAEARKIDQECNNAKVMIARHGGQPSREWCEAHADKRGVYPKVCNCLEPE
jgi:hypothetical protein